LRICAAFRGLSVRRTNERSYSRKATGLVGCFIFRFIHLIQSSSSRCLCRRSSTCPAL